MLEYLISIKKISLQEPCDNLGNTLLHKAVEANQPEIVKLLLSYGADKFAINRRKKTPWDLAANKPEMIEIFKKSK
jgi:ankyrin repeat protein